MNTAKCLGKAFYKEPKLTYSSTCSSVSIVNFEHVIAGWEPPVHYGFQKFHVMIELLWMSASTKSIFFIFLVSLLCFPSYLLC